ncbi:MAG: PHP domain-containing protein [Chloroflexi bacterium]|nr:PHP domain-containing protein [Chloroflexota bacterium]
MTGTIVDMHIHTTNGASDSQLRPEEMSEIAKRIGLTGVNVTEHDRVWDRYTAEAFRRDHPHLFLSPGMEVSTDMGHIVVVGLKEYVGGIRKCSELRRVVDSVGGFMVVAHPFRHFFDPVTFTRHGKQQPEMTAENLAKMPVFELVHGIEVLNGANTMRENYMALQVATLLGKPGTGGSDAHSTSGVAYYCTVFEKRLASVEDMLVELHAARFKPGRGLPEGNLSIFTLDDVPEGVTR